MAAIDLSTLDLTPYQSVPSLSAPGMHQLCVDLAKGMPKESPPHVVKSAKRMVQTAVELEAALVERVDDAGVSPMTEVGFDNGKDKLWGATKGQIDYRITFEHPSFDMLSPAAQAEINLPHKRVLAKYARQLDGHLFGGTGLGFLKAPFAEQVAHTRVRLKFIRDSPDTKHYVEVLTEERVRELEHMQARYDEMVYDRSMRDDSLTNLRRLRNTAQRHIAMYSAAVLTMIDEDSEPSLELVFAALQPMVNARTRRNYGTADEGEETGETTVDSEGLGADSESPILGPPKAPEDE